MVTIGDLNIPYQIGYNQDMLLRKNQVNQGASLFTLVGRGRQHSHDLLSFSPERPTSKEHTQENKLLGPTCLKNQYTWWIKFQNVQLHRRPLMPHGQFF